MSPALSVILTTYLEVADGKPEHDHDSTLARAIDSVRAQTCGDWELIVVSDHPGTEALQRIQSLIASYGDPRISCVDLPEHTGGAARGVASRQEGVRRATAELVAFLDADNWWTPEHLQLSLAALLEDRALDLVYCDSLVRVAPGNTNPFWEAMTASWGDAGIPFGKEFVWHKPDWGPEALRRLQQMNFIDTSEAVFRKEAYLASAGLTSGYASDWSLWKNLIAADRGNFHHLDHVGLCYQTSSLIHHLQINSLRAFLKSPFNFDMQRYLAIFPRLVR
jgi:glycosyltransferase involved in cell wall biosynthesis